MTTFCKLECEGLKEEIAYLPKGKKDEEIMTNGGNNIKRSEPSAFICRTELSLILDRTMLLGFRRSALSFICCPLALSFSSMLSPHRLALS